MADLAVRVLALLLSALAASSAAAQATAPFEPRPGRPGKDIVWVPTPQALVDAMLDLAMVTPEDLLIDLGSGDGVVVVSAARRGAKAIGVEYSPEMIELSRRNATAAGVARRVTFRRADLFETDLSEATVVTMFLDTALNLRLRPRLLDLRPGTRIVSNTWDMERWAPDETRTIPGRGRWRKALLWIVPAKVEGAWRIGRETLTLAQQFQMISGTLGDTPITDGRLRGDAIGFSVGGVRYAGRVNGREMIGTSMGADGAVEWRAVRR